MRVFRIRAKQKTEKILEFFVEAEDSAKARAMVTPVLIERAGFDPSTSVMENEPKITVEYVVETDAMGIPL